jgi:site-specific recombinase XerC
MLIAPKTFWTPWLLCCAATILLNHVGKDLREIQELLRHKNIRTTVRYTRVGYEQTRQTAEALSQALEWKKVAAGTTMKWVSSS